MGPKLLPILLLILSICNRAAAQGCTTLGQTPATAFPVCGSSVFSQTTVPLCINQQIHVPGCSGDGAVYADTNPFWYKFTCFKEGTLGFKITPAIAGGDDYDWQLFDVTGRNPDDVYVDNSLFAGGNWSGRYEATGASNTGTSIVECASSPTDNVNTFSKMPVLVKGHNYLLLVSHYNPTQVGYSLSFGGGSAVITDTTAPKLQDAVPNCAANKINIKLNKDMRCNSLAADGSDFVLSPANAAVTAAVATDCSSGFDMNSLVLTLEKPLPAGNYTLLIKNGNDENTLLDICTNAIPAGDGIAFTVAPKKPVDLDSLAPVTCAPKVLQVVFKKNVYCNTIAANGSDFTITGTHPVTISGASVQQCTGGLGNIVNITLSAPIVLKGDYHLTLKQGIDGNSIVDECGEEVIVGQTLDFSVNDTVSAAFNAQVKLGCNRDTIVLQHSGGNNINSWQWLFENNTSSNAATVIKIYGDNGIKTAKLMVTNGFCTDSSSQSFTLDNAIHAQFNVPAIICPLDMITVKDSSTGKISGWEWSFDNGTKSNAQNPQPVSYPVSTGEKFYSLRLIVTNGIPCYDTTIHRVKVLYTCYITVPTAFTPNGDGVNDYLYPTNALKAVNLQFRIYNRYGQQVFETTDWTRKWDGTIKGVPQATGVYAWYLVYTDGDNGQKHFLKGTSVLIR